MQIPLKILKHEYLIDPSFLKLRFYIGTQLYVFGKDFCDIPTFNYHSTREWFVIHFKNLYET